MNRFRLFALTGLTILAVGCAGSTPKTNPFAVSKQDIRDRVKTVAVATVRMDDDIPNATQAKQDFGELIANELTSLGFQVVPAAEFEKVFNRLRDEAGGFFDPNTGKADNEKYKKVQELCRREMATKFHADAVLYPTITVRMIPFSQDSASWDGVRESLTGAGWLEQYFGGTHYGTVPALVFCAGLYDVDNNKMYSKCGGVQLLSKLRGGGFAKVPDQNVLTDTQRNTNAVAIVFRPLHDEEPPQH